MTYIVSDMHGEYHLFIKLLEKINLFDVYEGDKCPEGKKSVAIEVVIQPKEKTLTDEEIDSLSRRIIGIAGKVADAQLRS